MENLEMFTALTSNGNLLVNNFVLISCHACLFYLYWNTIQNILQQKQPKTTITIPRIVYLRTNGTERKRNNVKSSFKNSCKIHVCFFPLSHRNRNEMLPTVQTNEDKIER